MDERGDQDAATGADEDPGQDDRVRDDADDRRPPRRFGVDPAGELQDKVHERPRDPQATLA